MTLKKEYKIALAILLISLAFVSFFVLGEKYSSIDAYEKIITTLDEKKEVVTGLTAALATSALAVSLIPSVGSTLAGSLNSLSTYLLIALAVLLLEKYLLTVIGFAVFKIFIPASLIMLTVELFTSLSFLASLAKKLLVFSLALMLIIPTSVKITNMIDETYEVSKNANSLVDAVEDQKQDIENNYNNSSAQQTTLQSIFSKIWNAIKGVGSAVVTAITTTTQQATAMLNKFVEAVAVLVVTSCLIPILTALVFVWMTNLILGTHISVSNMKYLSDHLLAKLPIWNKKPKEIENENPGQLPLKEEPKEFSVEDK